jgi:ABC-2 type transport system permease protein
MESLLVMPITPFEVMLGKIAPYVVVGFVQAALILGAGVLMFGVPIVGNLALLAALARFATYLSFASTLAQNRLQAIQMSMMFFLPNMVLSGFIFPFLGMPRWVQVIGEHLPLMHYMRIVCAIMLKGSTPFELQYDTRALGGLMRHAFPSYTRLTAQAATQRQVVGTGLPCKIKVCKSGSPRYRSASRSGKEP